MGRRKKCDLTSDNLSNEKKKISDKKPGEKKRGRKKKTENQIETKTNNNINNKDTNNSDTNNSNDSISNTNSTVLSIIPEKDVNIENKLKDKVENETNQNNNLEIPIKKKGVENLKLELRKIINLKYLEKEEESLKKNLNMILTH